MDAQEQRRLLELAAKAIGGRITQWDGETLFHPEAGYAFDWNPIDDDGDAFRLAVFLFRDIHFWYFDNSVSIGNDLRIVCGDDPCAATRLAIVRAAAAIGEKMP